MILNAILMLPLGLFALISSFFPALPISDPIASSISSAISSLWSLNSFIPVSTLAVATGILISLELIVLSFNFFNWLKSHIPFIGGRG